MEDKQFFYIILVILANFGLKCHGLPSYVCDGTESVEFIAHPETCAKYILCILGFPTIMECGSNQIFNPVTNRCEPGFLTFAKKCN